ncbi:DUF2235 domain-containing protein [Nitrosococcus wardiae]|uniref:DUF2235 domain-containing protein n=1 Tax=Nitrosococcus wardiae TaxID=1814290 RepID=A0A4P7BV28_9GAMM|nr:DUF2235 domain-containing protein [Nitrosococcus wardiae]QBQ53711.1 DUF2235 domain-containing protein [Nitrosococcus wardiae]
MSKHLVICFDGTWNSAEKGNGTNVFQLYQSISEQTPGGTIQQKWYDVGVGADRYERIRGAFGFGLSRNIQQGYAYLTSTYEEGDRIFLFGFSRGAYTARSLAGLIRKCGLLKKGILPTLNIQGKTPEQIERELDQLIKHDLVQQAYEIYRARDPSPDSPAAISFREKNSRPGTWEKPTIFLGVWDTVGRLGIPLISMQLVANFNNERYSFHDTKLSRVVSHAYHAVAVDEHRLDYEPTLWTPEAEPRQKMEQRWFPGAHSDVGGGYTNQPLAEISSAWIMQKAQEAGLAFKSLPSPPATAILSPITDSYRQFLLGIYRFFPRRRTRFYRPLGQLKFGNEWTDGSFHDKQLEDPQYRPPNEMGTYLSKG